MALWRFPNIGLPPVHFCLGFSMKETIQLWGVPPISGSPPWDKWSMYGTLENSPWNPRKSWFPMGHLWLMTSRPGHGSELRGCRGGPAKADTPHPSQWRPQPGARHGEIPAMDGVFHGECQTKNGWVPWGSPIFFGKPPFWCGKTHMNGVWNHENGGFDTKIMVSQSWPSYQLDEGCVFVTRIGI